MSKKKKNHKQNHNPRKNTSQKKDGVGFWLMEVSTDFISDDIRKEPENWTEVLIDECTFEMGGNIKLPVSEPHAYEFFELDETEKTRKIGSEFCVALLSASNTIRLFCHRNGKRYFSTNLDWDAVSWLFQLVYESNGHPFHVVKIHQDA